MEDVVIKKTVTTSSRTRLKDSGMRFKGKESLFGKLFNLFAKTLIVGCLLGIDFMLFAGAGNSNLFLSHTNLTPQALYILIGIFSFSFLIVFLFSFMSLLQNLVTAFFAAIFFVMFLNHFAQFDTASFLYPAANFIGLGSTVAGISHIIVAVIIFIAVFLFLSMCNKKMLALALFFVLFSFGGVSYTKYMNFKKGEAFVVLKDDKLKPAENEGKKFVYIALPDLASHVSLEAIKGRAPDPRIDKVINLSLGFYAKHGFEVYPNAYYEKQDSFVNLVQNLNPAEEKGFKNLIMNSVEKSGYWGIDKINDKSIFLKENQLFGTFKDSGYKISAYESREVDLCKKANVMIVDKCVEKQNFPVNLENLKLDNFGKAKVLSAQWIESMGLSEIYSLAHKALGGFMNVADMPVLGVSYDRLYVVDSMKTLDILAEDVIKDQDNSAYFAFVDLPSDMYIYDEYCRPKNTDSWINLELLPWVERANPMKVKNAYIDQTACLYGKLEEFMDKIEKAGIGGKTVVVIQGLNSVKMPVPGTQEVNFIEKFKRDSLSTIAIKDPEAAGGYKSNICLSGDILKQYIYKTGECEELRGTDFNNVSAGELKKDLAAYSVSADRIAKAQEEFGAWHEDWGKFNTIPDFSERVVSDVKKPEPKVEEAEKAAEPAKAVEAKPVEVKEEVKIEELPMDEEEVLPKPAPAIEPIPAEELEEGTRAIRDKVVNKFEVKEENGEMVNSIKETSEIHQEVQKINGEVSESVKIKETLESTENKAIAAPQEKAVAEEAVAAVSVAVEMEPLEKVSLPVLEPKAAVEEAPVRDVMIPISDIPIAAPDLRVEEKAAVETEAEGSIEDKVEVVKTTKRITIVEEDGKVVEEKVEEDKTEEVMGVEEFIEKSTAPAIEPVPAAAEVSAPVVEARVDAQYEAGLAEYHKLLDYFKQDGSLSDYEKDTLKSRINDLQEQFIALGMQGEAPINLMKDLGAAAPVVPAPAVPEMAGDNPPVVFENIE